MGVLTFLVAFAVVVTVGVLASGIVSMMHGDLAGERRTNQLMWARVGAQGLAVVLIALALVLAIG